MYRTETDFLGEKPVPAAAYYGIHTVRALENFAVSRQTVHPELIRAIATDACTRGDLPRYLGVDPARVTVIPSAIDADECLARRPGRDGPGTQSGQCTVNLVGNCLASAASTARLSSR